MAVPSDRNTSITEKLSKHIASYADALWARHAFLPQEHLLQRELTSVHGVGPITGRLPFFRKTGLLTPMSFHPS